MCKLEGRADRIITANRRTISRSHSTTTTTTTNMSELDSVAFEPGQQVQCETRFKDVYKGEVVAFDLNSNILIIKSPSTSGNNAQHDLHFLVLDNVGDVKLLEEQHGKSNHDLPSIDMKHIGSKLENELEIRESIIGAVGRGASQVGVSLFEVLLRTLHRHTDVTMKEKGKLVVLKSVVISPPYKESDCALLEPLNTTKSMDYVKNIVRKFWESQGKQ